MIAPHDTLIAFDVDGTLIQSQNNLVVWQLLNRHFHTDDAVESERFQHYLRKEISYAEWVDLDIQTWKNAGATRSEMETVIRRDLTPVPGAQETLNTLKLRGYRLAIISGTLDLTIDLLLPINLFEAIYTNQIWFDPSGAIEGWRATPFDMDGKAEALLCIAEQMQIPLTQTAFIGDHLNDLQVMEAAGVAIAFNPKVEEVKQAAKHVIEGDLRNLLELFP